MDKRWFTPRPAYRLGNDGNPSSYGAVYQAVLGLLLDGTPTPPMQVNCPEHGWYPATALGMCCSCCVARAVQGV